MGLCLSVCLSLSLSLPPSLCLSPSLLFPFIESLACSPLSLSLSVSLLYVSLSLSLSFSLFLSLSLSLSPAPSVSLCLPLCCFPSSRAWLAPLSLSLSLSLPALLSLLVFQLPPSCVLSHLPYFPPPLAAHLSVPPSSPRCSFPSGPEKTRKSAVSRQSGYKGSHRGQQPPPKTTTHADRPPHSSRMPVRFLTGAKLARVAESDRFFEASITSPGSTQWLRLKRRTSACACPQLQGLKGTSDETHRRRARGCGGC